MTTSSTRLRPSSIPPAEAADWTVGWVRSAPFGVFGYTDFRTRTVMLLNGLNLAEARATLLHEAIHVDRGPVAPIDSEVEEGVVEILAAAQLIPAAVLRTLNARVAVHGVDAAADQLGVDGHSVEAGCLLAAAAVTLSSSAGGS